MLNNLDQNMKNTSRFYRILMAYNTKNRGFLDYAYPPVFQKLDLFPSSDDGRKHLLS
jgi:hypothetical protein